METGNYILSKIEECFNECHPMILLERQIKTNLYLPKIAIDSLKRHFEDNFFNNCIDNKMSYRGINVVIGYELAIILAHEDYSLRNNPDLICKISL